MTDFLERLPGEPDEYWACPACEWECLPDKIPLGTGKVICPECGDRMIYVSDDVPPGWDRFEATIEAVRKGRIVPLLPGDQDQGT